MLSSRTAPSVSTRSLSRDDRLVLLVLGLTLATGAVDAVSYFSLDHVFTANMSGNIALLGIIIAQGIFPVRYVLALAGFVLGAALGWRWMRARGDDPIVSFMHGLRVQIAIMVLLAVAIESVPMASHGAVRDTVTFVLASAMGLQTALARRIGVEDINTTVATMTLHGLAADSRIASGDSRRWRRRAAVVFALLAGAAIAVSADRVTTSGGIVAASLIVAVVAVGARQVARDGYQPASPRDPHQLRGPDQEA